MSTTRPYRRTIDGHPAQPLARYGAPDGALAHGCATPNYTTTGDVTQSWDTALKARDSNDYSAGLTFQVRGPSEIYLIGVTRERMEFPELKARVIQQALASSASAVLIEDHGSGISLIQYAKEVLSNVIGVAQQADKATRMYAVTPILEGGALHLPKSAPWLDDFLEEYLAFPNGKYDDQVDALSQFLNWHHSRPKATFEVDWGWDDKPWSPGCSGNAAAVDTAGPSSGRRPACARGARPLRTR